MAIAEVLERKPRNHPDDGHQKGGHRPVWSFASVMESR